MGTNYFLADSRYMTPQEIELAHRYDQNALLCHRAGGRDLEGKVQLIYTLEIPTTLFFNLPSEVQLVNNNNDLEVKTIGDLIAQMERGGKIIPVDEAVKLDKEAHERWIRSRPNTEAWRSFMLGYGLDETLTAGQYLSRVHKKHTQIGQFTH